MIRLVLADDQAMVRSGLRLLLEAEPDIEVVGEAADGAAAVEEVRWRRPGHRADGRPDAGHGRARGDAPHRGRDGPLPSVVILTTFDLDEYLFEALRAGASGFLLKHAPADELIAAVRTVAGGNALLAPAVTGRVISTFARRGTPAPELVRRLDRLSDREREVLVLAARGRSNAEIAEDLVVGEATVKTHLSSVFAKLGLRDRVAAVVFAYESGLVEPGEGMAGEPG